MDRRGFLKWMALSGSACLAAPGRAGATQSRDANGFGVLADLSECGGCRMCEFACAKANDLPMPDLDADPTVERQPSETQWAVVNTYETSAGEVSIRRQCMHCNEPACATACLTKALVKTPEGPVIWRPDRCMGCRYCMVSCPFDMPKFEYHEAVPKIQKCRMCWERVCQGEVPACVAKCPNEALTFGHRDELLQIAHQRIAESDGDLVPHIYGEREAGGTGWLYISPAPFEELGVPTDLDTTPYPELTRGFLTSVPVVLVLWPAFLMGVRRATQARETQPALPAPMDET